MRIHHWFRTIAGALALTAAAETGYAQEYGVPGPGMAPPPGYGPANPGTMYPQGVPQGFDPWPQISPFGNGNLDQDQYRYSRGLWFEELLYKHRDFYGGIDAVYGFSKGEGNTRIGARTMTINDLTDGLQGYTPPPIAGPVGSGSFSIGVESPSVAYIEKGVYPFPFYFVDGGSILSTPRSDLFPNRKDSDLLGNVNAVGLNVRWGFEDADGVGLMLNGFYMSPASSVYQMGQDTINGVPITPAVTAGAKGKFLDPLGGSLPLYNGIPFTIGSTDPEISDVIGAVGAAQKFDIMFRVERRVETAGANLALYMSPLYKTRATMLRPYVGGRYMFVKESFGFRGIDSGFMYEIDGISGTTGGTNTVPSFRPDWDTAVQFYDQFEATINSTVRTHLAGPEAGLRYDLGEGDGFKVWGATTFGLMANQSEISLSGNNIGEMPSNILEGINMLEEDARFASTASHGRVSPLFEQTVAIDSRIFEALPYTNEIPVLNTAIFHFGYTFTAVGQMNRPLDVINWNGFPLTPSLNNNTQTFVYHRFNFGLEWKY